MLESSKGVRSLRFSISLSFAVHLFFALLCLFLIQRQASEVAKKPLIYVELDPLKQLQKTRDDQRRRLVQTVPGQKVSKALPDSFLGETSQVVDRETVSKNHETRLGRPPQRAQAKTTKKA